MQDYSQIKTTPSQSLHKSGLFEPGGVWDYVYPTLKNVSRNPFISQVFSNLINTGAILGGKTHMSQSLHKSGLFEHEGGLPGNVSRPETGRNPFISQVFSNEYARENGFLISVRMSQSLHKSGLFEPYIGPNGPVP